MDDQQLLKRFLEKMDWEQSSDTGDYEGRFSHGCFFEKPSFYPKDADTYNFVMGRNSYFSSISQLPSNTIIGRHCAINATAIIGAVTHNYRSLFMGERNLTSDEVSLDSLAQNPLGILTVIGCDVWIGAYAVVMSGVTVGHGACIGAGAIVTRDVEPYSIVIGVPAKHYKFRFDPSMINQLLEVRWWDLDQQTIDQLPAEPQEALQFIKSLS